MKTNHEISKVDFRNQPAANNAFIGAQYKLDEVIAALSEIRAKMTPCEGWAHAEGLCHDVNSLVAQTNQMRYLTKNGKEGNA